MILLKYLWTNLQFYTTHFDVSKMTIGNQKALDNCLVLLFNSTMLTHLLDMDRTPHGN